MTDAVTHHADSVTHHAIPDAADKASNRRKQVREANVRHRARRRDGRVRLVVAVIGIVVLYAAYRAGG